MRADRADVVQTGVVRLPDWLDRPAAVLLDDRAVQLDAIVVDSGRSLYLFEKDTRG